MKRIIFVPMFFLIFTSFVSLNAQWARTYGGSQNDAAESIQQTSDGGYIVAGSTSSFGAGDYDICLLKLSSTGTIDWQHTYGGSKSERVISIQQTSDGGYIVAGETISFGAGVGDIWVLKLSSTGTIDWQHTYGGSGFDWANSIQQTSDGGYIVAGISYSFRAGNKDIWVLRLSSTGTVDWQHTYGGSGFDDARSIQQTSDGGYIVAGTTSSFGAGYYNIWVLKLSSTGTIDWQHTYGGSNSDYARSIQQTSDGGYIVAGSTDSFGAGEFGNFLILKLLPDGDIDLLCGFIGSSNASVLSTSVSPEDTSVIPQNTDVTPLVTNVSPQETNASVIQLCQEYNLTISASAGGTTNPVPGTYTHDSGTQVSVQAYPSYGYQFSNWSGDVSGTTNPVTITMDSNKSITATFSATPSEETGAGDEGGKKGSCFIATAAYGSPLHPHLDTLRDFRDTYLMPSKLGRTLVYFYYTYSPFVANFIGKHKVLKIAVRIHLLPLVVFSYSMVHFGPIITPVILAFIFVLPLFLIGSSHLSFPRSLCPRRRGSKNPGLVIKKNKI